MIKQGFATLDVEPNNIFPVMNRSAGESYTLAMCWIDRWFLGMEWLSMQEPDEVKDPLSIGPIEWKDYDGTIHLTKNQQRLWECIDQYDSMLDLWFAPMMEERFKRTTDWVRFDSADDFLNSFE